MRQKITAFLLSALVFPGLGQLYNQDRKKGIFLVLATNLVLGILFLAVLILFSQGYYESFYPQPLTWEVIRTLLLEMVHHPGFYVPLGLLAGLWSYAVLDAVRQTAPKPKEEMRDDPG
jgi:hypothetical protein